MLKAITYILENNAGLQAEIGQNKAAVKYKVYPVVVPETESAPYCVCRVVSKQTSAKACGYNWTIEVVSYASSYDKLTTVNDAVIAALESQASGTINGEDFGFAVFDNEYDSFDKDHDLYSKTTNFIVHGI